MSPSGDFEWSFLDAGRFLGRWPHQPDGVDDPEDLLAELDSEGIAEAAVTHTISRYHDAAAGNDLVLRACSVSPRLRPTWVVLPDACHDVSVHDQLGRARDSGVRSFRVYPLDHGWTLEGPESVALRIALESEGLPLLVDAEQTTWPAVLAAARSHPQLPIVVCGVGYRDLRLAVPAMDIAPSVHVDLSYLGGHLALEWLVGRIGATRVVLATGSPTWDGHAAVTRLLLSGLDDEQLQLVGGGRMRELMAGAGGAA